MPEPQRVTDLVEDYDAEPSSHESGARPVKFQTIRGDDAGPASDFTVTEDTPVRIFTFCSRDVFTGESYDFVE